MPSSNIPPRTFGELEPSRWPGERLGLPQSGPRSVGRAGRRIAALCIDWAIAVVLVNGTAGAVEALRELPNNPSAIPAVFAVLQIIFIPTIGGSIGHRLLGMRVVALTGGYIGIWRPVVRTLLLCFVVPAVVWDSDQRGFHDKIAGTVLLRS